MSPQQQVATELRIERVWEMPNLYTFKMRCVAALLAEEMAGTWADPFSGKYSPAQVTNDCDLPAMFNMDGLEFLRSRTDEEFDGVLFDPPYSTEQALRFYKPRHGGTAGREEYRARCKDDLARVIRVGGKCISFGWESNGLGKGRGFEHTRILLIAHGACHNDTIVTVETKL